jgi:hypothetical protein
MGEPSVLAEGKWTEDGGVFQLESWVAAHEMKAFKKVAKSLSPHVKENLEYKNTQKATAHIHMF